ncbi:MAG: prepilin peptidase [Candidatus Omnitrophica bacterium]|nr:prepilin peptidase [Candidatus Omnitrophota bacterium]
MPSWLVWGFIVAVGACAGSFLNVCIYRMPREESIVWPGSRCPHCQKPIAWYDNIPVLSFLALRAQCRQCHQPIRWRYPIVEALTAASLLAVLWQFGLTAVGVIYAALVCSLIVASFIDLEFQIIPDEISLGGLAIGVALSALVPALHDTGDRWVSLERSVIGALTGGGLLYVTGSAGNVMLYGLRRLGVALRHHPAWRARFARYRHMRDSMGGGDIKLMAMAGSLLGWKIVTLAFFFAPVLALVPGLFMMVFRKTHVIPYGPFLSLGLVIAMFYGETMLRSSGIEETIRLMWSFYGPSR